MDLALAAELTFAVGAVLAALSLAAAVADRAHRTLLASLAALLGAAAVAAWVAFGIRRGESLAVSAAGLSLATFAELAAMRLRAVLGRIRQIDQEAAAAEGRLTALIQLETDERSRELERTLARARADSASLLAEQERRMGEERRRAAAERERDAGASLSEALIAAERQVESRLRAWTEDLERAQRAVADQLAQLAQKQRQLISDAETRIASDAERLEAESEQQREGLVRLRDELARAIQETVTAGNTELEAYSAERRRALHELNERIRRRERALAEQLEREEAEAAGRITATFADVERRQVEQLERTLERATSSYSDVAAQQFDDAIRGARESAAARLSRELDRAVQAFAREAERVLAERLAHVGDAGARRLEKRLGHVTAGLERQREEAVARFEDRLALAEQDLRRRLDTLAADGEAERAVLDARLQEIARRIDETIARA